MSDLKIHSQRDITIYNFDMQIRLSDDMIYAAIKILIDYNYAMIDGV